MKYSEKEIIKALNLIKDICSTDGIESATCPIMYGENCMFGNEGVFPDEWVLAKPPKEEVWRAFK